jgi:hypothetical protein
VWKSEGRVPLGKNKRKWESNKTGNVYSLEYTDKPKVFFTLQHVGHCCTDVLQVYCCVPTMALGHCCATFATRGVLTWWPRQRKVGPWSKFSGTVPGGQVRGEGPWLQSPRFAAGFGGIASEFPEGGKIPPGSPAPPQT